MPWLQEPGESDHPQADRADKAVAAIALFLQVVVLTFGYITWGQFGWRTYSKLAADMRIKDADQQRKSFVLVNCFTTLLKLDIQVRAARVSCRHSDGCILLQSYAAQTCTLRRLDLCIFTCICTACISELCHCMAWGWRSHMIKPCDSCDGMTCKCLTCHQIACPVLRFFRCLYITRQCHKPAHTVCSSRHQMPPLLWPCALQDMALA